MVLGRQLAIVTGAIKLVYMHCYTNYHYCQSNTPHVPAHTSIEMVIIINKFKSKNE